MKLLIAVLLFVSVAAAIGWIYYQQSRTTAAERAELGNLRAFKNRIHDHILTQTQTDSDDPFARMLLFEVQDLDRANANTTIKELA